MQLHHPPIHINKKGELRKAGFEFEYTGITLEESANIVATHFGGRAKQQTLNYFVVEDTVWGEFHLELDVLWMKKISEAAMRQRKEDEQAQTLETVAEEWLSPIVSAIMPYEIITPPLSLETIPLLDQLCARLRALGAKGTGASPLYAFGMHINPDMPDIEPAGLHRYISAFVLLQDWLKQEYPMDITRQIAPFAKLFSVDYGRHILNPDYQPDLATLIDDYLKYNPTRNRALDMLPLFTFLDKKRVEAVVQDELVKARPTFHYRMPNCSLDEPDWSVVRDWNLWVEVERLAEDKNRLRALGDAWLVWSESRFNPLRESWPDEVRKRMHKAV